jgi:hypothetical protein
VLLSLHLLQSPDHVKMNDIAGENLRWIVHIGFEAIVEVRVEAFYQLAMDLALIYPSPPWREHPTHESCINKETHSTNLARGRKVEKLHF